MTRRRTRAFRSGDEVTIDAPHSRLHGLPGRFVASSGNQATVEVFGVKYVFDRSAVEPGYRKETPPVGEFKNDPFVLGGAMTVLLAIGLIIAFGFALSASRSVAHSLFAPSWLPTAIFLGLAGAVIWLVLMLNAHLATVRR